MHECFVLAVFEDILPDFESGDDGFASCAEIVK
jgi:hypothetical protein